jgi:CubicO group peptidase (beta-lactamase class C family)
VSDDEIDPTAVSQAVRRGHQLREGYAYLQRVIEHVTGQPLAEHTWTNVLEPLGMHSSSYVWTDAFETHAAQGYDIEGKPVVKWRPSEDLIPESIGGEHPELSWLKDLYEQMPT